VEGLELNERSDQDELNLCKGCAHGAKNRLPFRHHRPKGPRGGHSAVHRAWLCQAGALYLYTPNKQTLLFDLLFSQMQGAVAALKAAELTGPAEMQLEGFVRAHLRYHLGGESGRFIPYTELRNLTAANYEKVEVMRRVYEAALEDIVVAGARSGRFEVEDSKLTTLVLISILNGVLTWYRPGGRVKLDAVEAHYVDIIGKAVRPARASAPAQ